MKKGTSYQSFVEAFNKVKSITQTEELPLMNIDLVYIDEKGGTIFHNGLTNAIDFDPKKVKNINFKGDGIRIGCDCYSISQKALMDIAALVGLKGEGLTESCRERSALISKKIVFNKNKYIFLLKDGMVVGIKKNESLCPSILNVIDALPSKNVHLGKGIQGKIVREWIITDDFYRVSIEYACLGKKDNMIPYCIVQDSDTGESSLTITFGLMFTKNEQSGFLPVFGKSYRHNKAVSITEIYQDVQYYIIDQFMFEVHKIEKAVEFPAETIRLPQEFTKNLSKKALKEICTAGDTVYDQIISLTVSTAKASESLGIKAQNTIMNALFEHVVLKLIV